MLHVCEKSKTNLAASWPRSVMRFFVRYSSVYLDEVSHFGNFPSKIQKLKTTIFVYLSSSGSMEIRILSSRNGSEWRVRLMSVWLKWGDRNGISTKSLFNTISRRRSNFKKGYQKDGRFLSCFLCYLKNRRFVWNKVFCLGEWIWWSWTAMSVVGTSSWKWHIGWAGQAPERLTILSYIHERISFLKA